MSEEILKTVEMDKERYKKFLEFENQDEIEKLEKEIKSATTSIKNYEDKASKKRAERTALKEKIEKLEKEILEKIKNI